METPHSRFLSPTSPFRRLLPLAAWFGPSVGALVVLISALSIPGLGANIRGALLLIAMLLFALAVPGVILAFNHCAARVGKKRGSKCLRTALKTVITS